MNYYSRHLGDYIRDTSHLSLLEHGIYTRLLDVYYQREAPIPDEQRYRLIRAQSEEEKSLVDAILAEFFTLVDGGWHQARCDAEITEYRAKAEKASQSARARWDKQKSEPSSPHTKRKSSGKAVAVDPKSTRTAGGDDPQCEGNANAMQSDMHSECERIATAMLTNNQEPSLVSEIQREGAGAPDPPTLELVRPEVTWLDFCEDASVVEFVTRLRGCEAYPDLPTEDSVRRLFEFARGFVPDDSVILDVVDAFVERARNRRAKKPEYSDPIRTIRTWLQRDEARFRQIRRERERDQRGIVPRVGQPQRVGIAAKAAALMAEAGDS